jgi:hypothetical protein
MYYLSDHLMDAKAPKQGDFLAAAGLYNAAADSYRASESTGYSRNV